MSNYCESCKYWRRGGVLVHQCGKFGLNPSFIGEIVGSTSDKHPVVCLQDEKSQMGLCLHPALGSDYVSGWLGRSADGDRTDGVFAGCDENRGHLTTGARFGCIHFSQ
jgi:hypothetical protein